MEGLVDGEAPATVKCRCMGAENKEGPERSALGELGVPSPEPHIRDLEPFTSSPGALRKSSRAAQPSAL